MSRREFKLAVFVWLVSLLRLFVMPIHWFFQTSEQRERTYLGEDQAWNAVLNGWPDESISARSHREFRVRLERFINWAFSDQLHCAHAYLSEMDGDQNAREYQG